MRRYSRLHALALCGVIGCALGACGTKKPAARDAGAGGAKAHAGGGGASADAGSGGSTASGGSGMLASGGRGGSAAASGGRGGSSGGSGHGGASVAGSGTSDASGTSGAAGSNGRSYSTTRDEFFGASRCSALGAKLCEDFEAAALDSKLWKVMGTMPALDTTRFARGAKSLHVHTTATGFSGIETSAIFPAPKNTYYGRMFVYFDALPSTPQWAHWTIVGANAKTSGAGEVRVGGQFDGMINRFGVGSDGGPTGDWSNLDGDPKGKVLAVPEDQWICVEWLHKGDTNETHFWWDGVEHPSLATTPDVKRQGTQNVPFNLPEFSKVWFGFWNYDQGKSVTPDHFDVWIDEIALDDARIGCNL